MKLTKKQLGNLTEIQLKYINDLDREGELNKVSTYRGATRVCYGENEIRYFYKGEFFSLDQAKKAQGFNPWEWRGTYYLTMRTIMNLIDKQEEAGE